MALPPAQHAVVVLADGLGAAAIRSRTGHARFLSARLGKNDVIDGVFPATTAAGLATLCTGVEPGKHGLVAYRVLDAANDRVVNQLNGWDADMDPATWQRVRTVFERAADVAVPSFSIGPVRYKGSGLTEAVLRGSEYLDAETIGGRFDTARRVIASTPGALVYLYVPELDMAAHARGWQSDRWLAELETLDAETSLFAASLAPSTGLLLTADHGVLDVPSTKHVLFDTVPELVDGVRHVGGDPRCLQLYLEPGLGGSAADVLAEAWRQVEGERAWILTRGEAVEAGLFGDVDPAVLPRIGDVIVAARRLVAYYDSRDRSQAGRTMIGQHGALTDEEMRIPLIRAGAYGR
ncbi:alkaline phosphatase family protein [Luethyella okanaganae]|uniref:Alkaline phosphatase family protein n=1 Tax=Luethyella okanaganae TaxID=69372 RepID=A0ABW1VDV3_9MICO